MKKNLKNLAVFASVVVLGLSAKAEDKNTTKTESKETAKTEKVQTVEANQESNQNATAQQQVVVQTQENNQAAEQLVVQTQPQVIYVQPQQPIIYYPVRTIRVPQVVTPSITVTAPTVVGPSITIDVPVVDDTYYYTVPVLRPLPPVRPIRVIRHHHERWGDRYDHPHHHRGRERW